MQWEVGKSGCKIECFCILKNQDVRAGLALNGKMGIKRDTYFGFVLFQ